MLNLLARKPKKLAAIALANKMARTLWAMMVSGEVYQPRPIRLHPAPGHPGAGAAAGTKSGAMKPVTVALH